MNSDLMKRVNDTWTTHFQLLPEHAAVPGTSLRVSEHRNEDSYIILWPVGEHVVVEIPSAAEEMMRQLLSQMPAQHRLTLEDLKQAWDYQEIEIMPLYAMDAALFRPAVVSSPYTLRQLSLEDQPAFDAFLTQCSEADREEGDVGLDHMIAFGIFQGSRIVCASSVFIWRGFIDIGILTDPSYRGQRLGKAAVSACVAHYLAGDLVVGYRHDVLNRGSQGIGVGLGFSYYADAEMIKLKVT